MKVICFFLCLGFALSPIYYFPSGLPQPSDFTFAVFFLVTFLFLFNTKKVYYFSFTLLSPSLLAIAFLLWALFVSVVNALLYQDAEILLPWFFYFYNTLFFISIVLLGTSFSQFRSCLEKSILIAATVLLIFILGGTVFELARQTAGFNNPNQLGYYSLLLITLYLVIDNRRNHSLGLYYVLFVAGLGVLLSSSISSLASFFIILIAFSVKYFTLKFNYKTLAMASFIVLAVGLAAFNSKLAGQIFSQWESRFSTVESKLANVDEARGYNRIIEYPEFILFGAGERARWRFGPEHSHELHSSIGTIIFSYGLIGLSIFLLFLYACFSGARAYVILLLVAVMVYSLTHLGLRTSFLWVFFAVSFLYGRNPNSQVQR